MEYTGSIPKHGVEFSPNSYVKALTLNVEKGALRRELR